MNSDFHPHVLTLNRNCLITLRKIIRGIHRDLGYLCVGGMLVYAISGVLLNHIHDFNSSYRIVRQRFELPEEVAARASES